ncbi:MAG TPA: sigma-70 family RNA polymerase sigma factor [Planctomycetota bacterium]|nr:sigma-70 family RNA polymerase sigma factor [Planctomycetota bacterium]
MTGVPSSLSVHELLTEQDFVHRLARSLVFDQDRVDDVVQEAWLAAMRHPPQRPAAVAGWFRSVLGNLARRRSRDEARRKVREELAARPEALPSADDVVVREQRRQEVVEAVLSLAEPYRGTVLARFFDDLEPIEIARRRGVPAATVRSQLKRGLDMLRERLGERHGERWGLWLLSLARPEKATGLAFTSIAGGLLMAKVLFGCGLLALLVLGFWYRQEMAPDPLPVASVAVEPAATAVAAVPPPASEVAPAADVVERTAVATPRPAPRPSPGSSGLRGRIVAPDGTPLPGQRVRALGIDGVSMFADAPVAGADRSLVLQRGSATTDADGVFVIHDLAARTRYAVHAAVDGPDRTMRLVDATPLPGETVDIGDFVLVPKGSIAGRAVDDDGEPIAGAEVLALDLPAAIVAAVPIDRFDPRLGGMLSVPLPHGDGDAKAYGTTLRRFLGSDLFERADLDKEEGLTTLVLDHLPWAEQIWNELPFARATTAADGSFTVQGVEPGGNLLVVRRAGRATGSRPRVVVRAGETSDVGEVRLPVGETLAGRVRDAHGEPVAGAEVRAAAIGLLGYRGVAFSEAPVLTRADGAFEVTGMGRGRVFVAARPSADSPWHVVGPVRVDDEVDLQLPALHALDLRLQRADQAEVGDVQVDLFAGPLLAELRRAGLQQQLPVADGLHADHDGVVRVGVLPAGTYALVVRAEGTVPVEAFVSLPRDEPIALVLPAAGPHVVHVQTESGEAIAGALVYVARGDAGSEPVLPSDYGLASWRALPTLAGRSDANGDLQLANCPIAPFTLMVLHEQHAGTSVDTVAGATATTVVMPAFGELTGQLFDHGVPADPQRYCIVAESYSHSTPIPELRARLQADGSFTLRALAPGDYTVHAEAIRKEPLSLQAMVLAFREIVMPMNWTQDPSEQYVTVQAGATATVRFDVDANQPKPGEVPARLHGRVIENGVPFADAVIDRLTERFSWAPLATVAADGSFRVETLSAGRQQLRVREKDQQWMPLWEGTIDVKAGADVFLDLAWTTGPVRGSVAFLPGLPTAEYYVVANGNCNGGGLFRQAPVGADGSFHFDSLPLGDYEFSAHGPDGKSPPVSAQVGNAGAPAAIRLQLAETLALRGRVASDGDLDGMMVFVRDDHSTIGTGLRPGARFAFSDLEPHTYRVSLMQGGRQLAVEPSTFDLAQGSQRDVVLRVLASENDR